MPKGKEIHKKQSGRIGMRARENSSIMERLKYTIRAGKGGYANTR